MKQLRHFTLFFILLTQNTQADPLQLFGQWNTLNVTGYFGSTNWFYNLEESDRNSMDTNGNFGLAQINSYEGVGYKFNDAHSVLAGFWYQYTQPPYSGQYVSEANAYQRYTYTTKTPAGKLSLRTQLEERNNISQASASGASVRYRQQAKLVYPILESKWSAVLTEEVFVNLNNVNWGPSAGFDQNRAFVGLGYDFNKVWRTEFGYMNQYVNRNLNSDFIDNQLSLNLYVNVPR